MSQSVEKDVPGLKCECRGGPHGGYTCDMCSSHRARLLPPTSGGAS